MDQSLQMNQQSMPPAQPQGEEEREKDKKEEKVQEEMNAIIKADYEKLKQEAAEYLDGWKRAKADYINLKRETEARQAEFAQFAAREMLIGLIPIYDHLQKAVAQVPEDRMNNPWIDGVIKICQEFEKFLQDEGVETMRTEGEQFDPSRHEALGSEKKGDTPPNAVLREVKTGYTLYGKVLIPAQVIVASET